MERIRKGNDISIRWEIYARAGKCVTPYDLTGRDLGLYLSDRLGRSQVKDYTIDGHAVEFMFRGKDQMQVGRYCLTLVENEGKDGMRTVDECDAFELVIYSCLEGGDKEGTVDIARVDLESAVNVAAGGGGPVDSELNPESGNAISNAAVAVAIAHVMDIVSPADFNEHFNEDFAI